MKELFLEKLLFVQCKHCLNLFAKYTKVRKIFYVFFLVSHWQKLSSFENFQCVSFFSVVGKTRITRQYNVTKYFP